MRMGWVALLALALAVVGMRLASVQPVPPLEWGRGLALVALCAWTAVEAFAAAVKLRRHRQELAAAKEDRKVEADRAADLAEQLTVVAATVSRLERDLRQAEAKAMLATQGGGGEAVGLLALLQEKGRFIDFVMDDVTLYSDAQVGAAARLVHQGCKSVVRDYFDVRPVHDGQEGTALTLGADYDTKNYRLLGRVSGEPPFTGRLLHRGWLTTAIKLPERPVPASEGPAAQLIAPAEVELS